LIKNSQPFGKKFQKTAGGDFFLTHTVYTKDATSSDLEKSKLNIK